MNGGDLQKKITFFKYETVSDGAGGSESQRVDLLTTWASVMSVKSSMKLEALQNRLEAAYKIRLRMRKGFEPQSDYSIEYKGQELSILMIDADQVDNREWTIVAAKRDGKG